MISPLDLFLYIVAIIVGIGGACTASVFIFALMSMTTLFLLLRVMDIEDNRQLLQRTNQRHLERTEGGGR